MLARAAPVCSLLASSQAARRAPACRQLRLSSHRNTSVGAAARHVTMGSLAADISPAVVVQKGPTYRVRGLQLAEHRLSASNSL